MEENREKEKKREKVLRRRLMGPVGTSGASCGPFTQTQHLPLRPKEC